MDKNLYNAYIAEEVVTNLPFESTCLISPLNNNNQVRTQRLFIGSRQGDLLNCHQSPGKHGFEYEAYRSFEKRAITDIDIVESHNLILCLSDGQLTVHEACEPYKLQFTLTKYRAITTFAHYVQKENNLLYVSISSKKRLIILKWLVDALEEMNELSFTPNYLIENAQKILWCSSSLFLAVRNEYSMVKVLPDKDELNEELGKIRPLFSPGIRTTCSPLIFELHNLKMIGLARDSQIIFMDQMGNYSKDFPNCEFSDSPSALAYDFPYIVAVLGKSTIEIRSIRPSTLIQRLMLNKASMICQGKPGYVYVGAEHTAWRLNSKPLIPKNIQFLVEKKQYELALQLVNINPSAISESQRVEIQRQMAQHFFGLKKFNDCFNIHLELKSDVLLVVNFFVQLVPEKYLAALSKIPPSVLQLFESPEGYGAMTENERKVGILALGEHLAMVLIYLTVLFPRFAHCSVYYLAGHIAKRRSENEQPIKLHYMDYREGRTENLLPTNELKRYEAQRELIDTILLKCYLISNPQLVSSLLRLQTCSCLISEAEKDLFERNKCEELLIFYWRQRMYKKALELLKREASIEGSPLYGLENLARHLMRLKGDNQQLLFEYSPLILSTNVELGVQIFTYEEDEEFDDSENDEQEILINRRDFNKEIGKIREHKRRNLDKDAILQFLKEHCVLAIIPYLEHLIYKCSDATATNNPRFHQAILEEYIRRVRELMGEYLKTLDFSANHDDFEENNELSKYRRKLQQFLEKSQQYDPKRMLLLLDDDDTLLEERAIVYGRLGRYEDAIYIYSNVLMDFEAAERFCQQNSDENQQNLFSILFEAYVAPSSIASRIREAAISRGDQPYKFLVNQIEEDSSTNNSGRNPRRQNIAEALKVLRKHAREINTVNALSHLPDEITLSRIWESLESVFEALKNKASSALHVNIKAQSLIMQRLQISIFELQSSYNEEQQRNCFWKTTSRLRVQQRFDNCRESKTGLMLSITEHAVKKTNQKLASLSSSQSVVIDYSVECVLCGKRIGKSAFIRQCDMSIAHFFCHEQRVASSISPTIRITNSQII